MSLFTVKKLSLIACVYLCSYSVPQNVYKKNKKIFLRALKNHKCKNNKLKEGRAKNLLDHNSLNAKRNEDKNFLQ